MCVISFPEKLNANGTAIGIIIAYVPHEVPVEKATMAVIMNASIGSSFGVSHDSVLSMIKPAVLSIAERSFNEYARAKIIIAGIIPLIPIMAVLIISFRGTP